MFIHDGNDNEVSNVFGTNQSFTDQLAMNYAGGTDAHYNVDRIDTFSGELLFSCEGDYGRMIKNEGENFKTVSSSIILGALVNGYDFNLKPYLAAEIVNYFIGYDPVTSVFEAISETQLVSNSPNPFSSETTISCFLDQPGVVMVEIFNGFGQKIKTIIEDVPSAGDYSVVWNGKDESGNQAINGHYFYRISTGTQRIFNTMILIK